MATDKTEPLEASEDELMLLAEAIGQRVRTGALPEKDEYGFYIL